MPERTHLSIGEVLSLLRQEFPDVTISKIRFLESQGLVDPERTPSGYRKFYEQDVERLRWILRQQREHFLPLKVIRGRLEGGGEGTGNGAEAAHLPGLAPGQEGEIDPDPEAPGESGGAEEPAPAESDDQGALGESRSGRPTGPATLTAEQPAPPEPGPSGGPAAGRAGAERRPSGPATRAPAGSRSPAAAPAEDRPRREAAAQVEPPVPAPEPVEAAALPPGFEQGDTFSAEELASAAGATPALVVELKQYGLISAHAVVAGTPYFDHSALAVTKAAVGFSRHGVEARHLRAWRNAADRETALFEQLIMPLLRQRNPQARRQASETVADLARLGGELRAALIERSIRDIR